MLNANSIKKPLQNTSTLKSKYNGVVHKPQPRTNGLLSPTTLMILKNFS